MPCLLAGMANLVRSGADGPHAEVQAMGLEIGVGVGCAPDGPFGERLAPDEMADLGRQELELQKRFNWFHARLLLTLVMNERHAGVYWDAKWREGQINAPAGQVICLCAYFLVICGMGTDKSL